MRSKKIMYFPEVFCSCLCMITWADHILGLVTDVNHVLAYVQVPSRVRVMRDADNVGNSSVGEKLCKHKYSSYPYCYGEITTEMSGESL